ncbi:hypothetical protein [Streptomyces fradiae]
MDWWIWLIIGVVILMAVAGAVLMGQARRRRGGVIADRAPRRRANGGPG